MNDDSPEPIDFKIDRNNLYLEETFTDLKGSSVARFTPVKPDGAPDKERRPLFLGQTSLYTPEGPVPIQSPIQAKDLPQALKRFPGAMQAALERLVEEAKSMRTEASPPIIQTADSRIIVP